MRYFLVISILMMSLMSFGQTNIKFKFPDTRVLTDINGDVIDKGDQFDVIIYANGNGDTQTRQLLFDLQYDYNNLELVSVTHTGTGGNGGILPQNSNPQLSWQNYPNYSFVTSSQNTTTNGTTNYQNSNYKFVQGQSSSIIRATLTWATTNGMPYSSYDRLLVVRFKVKSTITATSFNPIKLNFVAGWSGQGVMVPTIMETPLSTEVIMNQNTGKLVTAKVDVNSNLLDLTDLKVSFRNTQTNTGVLFNVLSNGNVDINQSLLEENKTYEVSVMHNMDKSTAIYNGAITISDFTTAQSEFTSMGLDGSNGQILKTGQSLYAADINRNKTIDGGDLPKLLAQAVGIDVLYPVPSGYVAGSGGYMSLPTWRSTDATTTAGQVEWCVITPNSYGTNLSKVLIDVRKFGTTDPTTIKSLQLFDLYVGPIQYVGSDNSWVEYKVPSNFSTITTSSYLPYIRPTNGDYGIKAEFEFNPSPSESWGSITSTNWKDITYPKTYVKTGLIGSNVVVDLKYLVWGDVNRSHSSQVVTMNNNENLVVTNAVNSLNSNKTFKTLASQSTSFINTPINVPSIDANLSNLTVTSNTIEIPINIVSNGNDVGGLQFEFLYDNTKLKFEELMSSVPNTWYIFANSVDGRVKFGAIDQNNKTSINGNTTPFKLKFSTIGNGVDILTSVKVSPTMDASSSKGTQLGINLNTTQIKLTGYKNF